MNLPTYNIQATDQAKIIKIDGIDKLDKINKMREINT